METEVRPGGNNYTLLLVLFLIFVIGGATGVWFCFQQYQTLTYLTDNLMGIQMKIVKLQSSHEEMRQSGNKVRMYPVTKTASHQKHQMHLLIANIYNEQPIL